MSTSAKTKHPKAPERAPEKAAENGRPSPDWMMSPGAFDALLGAVKSSDRLARIQAEKLKSDDGYRVIDPRTVAGTMQVNSGRVRFVSLPAGTIKLTSSSICASLPSPVARPPQPMPSKL